MHEMKRISGVLAGIISVIQIILLNNTAAGINVSKPPPEMLSNLGDTQTIAYANDSSKAILQSTDGEYQWKFVTYNGSSRRLLVIINTQFNTTVVWIANRNTPVSPNATVFVQTTNTTAGGARIVLAEPPTAGTASNRTIAWSTPTGVRSVQMNSSGNLIMRDAAGNLIWQSFDEASDVMVPGQFLTRGHNATASLAWNDVTAGHYSLRVGRSSFGMYASFDSQQYMLPYIIIHYDSDIYDSTKYDHRSASPCNHSALIYKSDARGLSQEQMTVSPNGTLVPFVSPQCQAQDKVNHEIPFIFGIQGDGFRYLRVMPTGDVNTFLLDSHGLHVDNEIILTYSGTYCKLPSYCGTNGICSLSSAGSNSYSSCTCPPHFSPIDDSDPSKGCRHDTPLNCSVPTEHSFIPVTGVDYYANPNFEPYNVTSADACIALCSPNCSCSTAFHDNATGNCYLYETLQTMQAGVNPTMTAYLRIAKLPDQAPSGGRRSLSNGAVAAISITAAVVVISLLLLGIWTARKLINDHDESDDEDEAFLEALPGLPPRYSYKELHKATDGFSNTLGKGASGAVFVGIIDLRQGSKVEKTDNNDTTLSTAANKASAQITTKVAVKELQHTGESSTLAATNKKQFRAEVATLGRLSHINLVDLKGFCMEGSHRLLIFEYLENGSLDRWIFSTEPKEVLPWEIRYRIAMDTARGLAFLHEGSRDKVLHLDVKPQNILLDGDFRAKLADFGLAKFMDRNRGNTQTLTAVRGTPGYMAPEWLLNLPITDRSDVFSYGMVLLELVGGRKNINLELDSDIDEWYFPTWAVKQAQNGNLVNIIDERLMSGKDEVDKECETNMSRLVQVAFWCIQENAPSRPRMSTILLMLEKHIETPPPPLELTYVASRSSPLPPNVFQNYNAYSEMGGMNKRSI